MSRLVRRRHTGFRINAPQHAVIMLRPPDLALMSLRSMALRSEIVYPARSLVSGPILRTTPVSKRNPTPRG